MLTEALTSTLSALSDLAISIWSFPARETLFLWQSVVLLQQSTFVPGLSFSTCRRALQQAGKLRMGHPSLLISRGTSGHGALLADVGPWKETLRIVGWLPFQAELSIEMPRLRGLGPMTMGHHDSCCAFPAMTDCTLSDREPKIFFLP